MGATLAITARERNESTTRMWVATLIAAVPGLLLLALVLHRAMWAVQNNLVIANADWEDFADAVDPDGVRALGA
jgi:hypothetical protein